MNKNSSKHRYSRFSQQLLFFCLLLFIISCGSSSKLSRENLAGQFDFSKESLNPSFVIFHSDTDSSIVYYQIEAKNLLLVNKNQDFYATLAVKYQLYPSFTSTSIIDSGSFTYDFMSHDSTFIAEGNLKFRMPIGTEGVLKITMKDVNRKTECSRVVSVKKSHTEQRQFYLLTDTSGRVLYRNYLSLGEHFQLQSRLNLDTNFIVRCYFRNFPLAAPPFFSGPDLVFNYNADSLFNVAAGKVKDIQWSQRGFYHFQNDSITKDGFTLFIFNDDFPFIRNAEQLIEPTRYLTTKKEYQNLVAAKNKKAAADKFWLDLGGNQDRSRTLIKLYYQRVQESNMLFTSYTEGWKTDRGMIYLIFGQPLSVYDDGVNVEWNYRALNGDPYFQFSFRRIPNPFTDNDYSLIRMPVYENGWYVTVDEWRQGKIVNQD